MLISKNILFLFIREKELISKIVNFNNEKYLLFWAAKKEHKTYTTTNVHGRRGGVKDSCKCVLSLGISGNIRVHVILHSKK